MSKMADLEMKIGRCVEPVKRCQDAIVLTEARLANERQYLTDAEFELTIVRGELRAAYLKEDRRVGI